MKVLKYNKLIIVLAFALLSISTASAQLRFGLKGGFDVSSNRLNKDILNAHNRLGFQVGGTMELMAPIVGWGGELSVLYGHQKFDIDGVKGKEGQDYDISSYNYLRVPLNLKKKFSVVGLFGVFIQAGPYIEFKLSGADVKDKGNIGEQWKSKSFGAGLNAGAGVELLNHLEIGMYYRKSLTNNYDDNAGFGNILKKKPDNWSVDLTYFF
jgi:hypothetical protein